MKTVSFIIIKDRIEEILNSITIDDYYFDYLKKRIIEEYEFPEELSDFYKQIDEVILNFQKQEEDNLRKIKETENLIKNQEDANALKLKMIEKELKEYLSLKQILEGIPLEVQLKKTEIDKLQNEVKLVSPLADKEPYKLQLMKLGSEIQSLNQWIQDAPKLKSELDAKMEKLVQESKDSQSELDSEKELLNRRKQELNEFIKALPPKLDFQEEGNAIQRICQLLYKKNLDYEIVEQKVYDDLRRVVSSGYKLLKFVSNSNPLPIPSSFVASDNLDFIKSWREVLMKVFNNSPDFTKISSVSYCASFPNLNFEIYSKSVDVNFYAAIWMSLQHALLNRPGMVTKDGKIYLWVTNAIFVEIRIRKQMNSRQFAGLFNVKRKDSNNRVSYKDQADITNIIGGYTSSGYYIPYGVYIIDKKISVEIYFYQNALLQDSISITALANQNSSASLVEDRRKADDDDD